MVRGDGGKGEIETAFEIRSIYFQRGGSGPLTSGTLTKQGENTFIRN
jgi:hypothetical protein